MRNGALLGSFTRVVDRFRQLSPLAYSAKLRAIKHFWTTTVASFPDFTIVDAVMVGNVVRDIDDCEMEDRLLPQMWRGDTTKGHPADDERKMRGVIALQKAGLVLCLSVSRLGAFAAFRG